MAKFAITRSERLLKSDARCDKDLSIVDIAGNSVVVFDQPLQVVKFSGIKAVIVDQTAVRLPNRRSWYQDGVANQSTAIHRSVSSSRQAG